jgi:hypothetical protein
MSGLRSAVLSAMVVGLVILGGSSIARADDYGKCQDKLADAHYRLNHDTERHGPYSRQAQNDRERLGSAENWCGQHHIFVGRDGHGRSDRYAGGYGNYDREGDADRYRDYDSYR